MYKSIKILVSEYGKSKTFSRRSVFKLIGQE